MTLKSFFVVSFYFFLLGSVSLVGAQVSATIILTPKYPAPRSTVTLTLQSYSFNTNTANIVWKVGGKVVKEGRGEKTITMRTGDVGQTSSVTVSSLSADGTSVEQEILVTPSSVALLYEAPHSYVPHLYEGRSLPSDGGVVRVTAFPSISDSGAIISPSSLSYSWYVGDTLIQSGSGIGKQTLTTRLDYLQTKTDIKVLVQSPLGNTAEKIVEIYPHQVLPLMYVHNTILGTLFSTLIEKRFETTEEFTLSLEPFYVSNEEDRPATYAWYLDGLPFTPLGGRILSFRPQENSQGSKMLTIKVLGGLRNIQKAESQLEFIFDTRK